MTDIILEIDGQRYSFWKQMSVNRSLESFSGTFSFIVSGKDQTNYPIKVGQNCVVKIDETSIMNGFVEHISGTLDGQGSDDITVQGRDKTADINDSTIGDNINLSAPTTLSKLAKKILSVLNITDINVIEDLQVAEFKELVTVEPGTSGFDYLEKYAKKRQVLLTTNGNGDIVFTRASTRKLKTLLSTATDTPARILKREFSVDFSKRFNKYIIKNQNNDATGAFWAPTDQKATNDEGVFFDSEIRTSRIHYEISDYSSIEAGELKDRAKWEANFKKAQSRTYTCTVQGFYAEDDNIVWAPNHLVSVQDEGADINKDLLISDVTYNLTNDSGSTTILKLVWPDSFTLKVEEPDKDKKEQPLNATYWKNPQGDAAS